MFCKRLQVKIWRQRYVCIHGQDNDDYTFFEARDLIKVVDSTFNVDGVKVWWKHEGGSFKKDLKPFRNDEDATLLSLIAEKNQCEVEICIEAKPSTCEFTYMGSDDFSTNVPIMSQ